jgi:hypothetical protein
MTPRCTDVLKAIIFLESNQLLRKTDIIRTAVRAIPKPKFIYHIESVTPATTIVEECNKDETGVGPSIAMGNQYERIQIADLPRTATKQKIQFLVIPTNNIMIKKSPIRLYNTAAMDEDNASDRCQKPIKRKLINLILSHLTTILIISPVRNIIIPLIKVSIMAMNTRPPFSLSIYHIMNA